jgi:cobalt-zinc-cadmium resistance protein CzcA
VERNLLRGMLLVVVILIFFLYDFRAGLIVATTIPLALLFAFHLPRSAKRLGQPALHRRGGFRHPGGWRGGDGGKYFPPDRRAREPAQRPEIIRDAAAEVDRPLFYAVAVIVASFLPIYVWPGRPARCSSRWRTRWCSR